MTITGHGSSLHPHGFEEVRRSERICFECFNRICIRSPNERLRRHVKDDVRLHLFYRHRQCLQITNITFLFPRENTGADGFVKISIGRCLQADSANFRTEPGQPERANRL